MYVHQRFSIFDFKDLRSEEKFLRIVLSMHCIGKFYEKQLFRDRKRSVYEFKK